MSRRVASLAAEQKTKEELNSGAVEDDDDDPEDESFGLKDVNVAGKKKTPLGPGKRGIGAGICLSDDEEEEAFTKVNEATTVVSPTKPTFEAAEATAETAGSTPKQDTTAPSQASPTQRNDKRAASDVASSSKLEGLSGMGSILARMNRPKKKSRKSSKGGMIDKSLARLLAEDGDDEAKGKKVDKKAASEAARAALAKVGKMEVMEQVRFAGQTISVAKSVEKSSKEAEAARAKEESSKEMSTLDKIVTELKNPKKSISAVEKSSYDWEKFKEEKGIGEQLEKYAQNGYVEKQAFLQRVDQRTFEVERAERDRARALAAAAAAKAEKK